MAEVSAQRLVPQFGGCCNRSVAHTAARVCLHMQERGGSSLTQQQLLVAPQEESRVAFSPTWPQLLCWCRMGTEQRSWLAEKIRDRAGKKWNKIRKTC